MALENVKEAVTLTGDSVVNEEVVVSFNCRVEGDGIAGSVNQYIRNHELYQEHRSQVRQDLQAFQGRVWGIEDRMHETGE